MAHAGGRPTKLTEELIAAANKYLDESDMFGPASLLPTVERLCLNLGISRETYYDWSAKKPEFSDISNRLSLLSADKLQQNGLTGRWNATVTGLLLSKHGYVRQTDVTTNGKELPTPILGGVSVQSDDSNPKAT